MIYSNFRDVTASQRQSSPGILTKRMCWSCQKPRSVQAGSRVIRGLWRCVECVRKMEVK